jgi:decaprenylphospho-beta-D-erythro-pentofuranosid-2-ulose 2-reductase
MNRQRIIIIGGTSAIAEHCARLWLRTPSDLLLVGRDAAKLSRVVRDLEVRSPDSAVASEQLDFEDPEAIDALLVDYTRSAPIDIALIAHGSLADQALCQQNPVHCSAALVINGISPALFMEAIAARMELAGRGHLVVIGSVAGDRGRKSNYVYGAAKGMLERYAQGMQHRLWGSGISLSLVKPGPTRTPMTAGLDNVGGGLAEVENVAAAIVAGVAKGKPVIYAPGKWFLIMMVIRHLPRFVFNRMDI